MAVIGEISTGNVHFAFHSHRTHAPAFFSRFKSWKRIVGMVMSIQVLAELVDRWWLVDSFATVTKVMRAGQSEWIDGNRGAESRESREQNEVQMPHPHPHGVRHHEAHEPSPVPPTRVAMHPGEHAGHPPREPTRG